LLADIARGKEVSFAGSVPYQVITKDGGPDQTVDGLVIKNPSAEAFQKTLRDTLASAKK
jgi:hypothetical protein